MGAANRTNLELKLGIIKKIMRTQCAANRTNLELKRKINCERVEAAFCQSHQSGIETLFNLIDFKFNLSANRTNLELKQMVPTSFDFAENLPIAPIWN